MSHVEPTAVGGSQSRSSGPPRPLVVAITGVAGSIGSRLAARLSSRAGEVRVVGIDAQPLPSDLGADLRQGDLRTDDRGGHARGS